MFRFFMDLVIFHYISILTMLWGFFPLKKTYIYWTWNSNRYSRNSLYCPSFRTFERQLEKVFFLFDLNQLTHSFSRYFAPYFNAFRIQIITLRNFNHQNFMVVSTHKLNHFLFLLLWQCCTIFKYFKVSIFLVYLLLLSCLAVEFIAISWWIKPNTKSVPMNWTKKCA